jgi:hypothetical protein
MATCLFHVTGPVQAYQIAKAGRYVPFSVDPMNTDACLNLYATVVRGKPAAQAPDGQQVEAAGAALVVEWDGPEEVLSTWQTLPKPNVLYHQPWDQYKHADPLEEPEAYYRSLVAAGTDRYLKIVGFKLDEEIVEEAWVAGDLPDEMMGLWRFAPKALRRLKSDRGIKRIYAAMQGAIGGGDNGRTLVVDG